MECFPFLRARCVVTRTDEAEGTIGDPPDSLKASIVPLYAKATRRARGRIARRNSCYSGSVKLSSVYEWSRTPDLRRPEAARWFARRFWSLHNSCKQAYFCSLTGAESTSIGILLVSSPNWPGPVYDRWCEEDALGSLYNADLERLGAMAHEPDEPLSLLGNNAANRPDQCLERLDHERSFPAG